MCDTCRNCKFWGRYKTGVCDRIEYDNPPTHPGDASIDVRVMDDSGLDVWFRTGPDFGCSLFEKKTRKRS